ncbi:MAG: leucine-rich repeat domain-containing protein [Salinivirgaceae bacterium]|nr:leucine-rich repeat domain-containing protein [Salinivirgaceae bacterium]
MRLLPCVTRSDIRKGVTDSFGVVYSTDGTRLLKCKNKKISEYAVKDGTIAICYDAFTNCRQLKRISVSKTVEDIYDRFKGCVNLESIDVDADNTRFVSDNGVLFFKSRTILHRFPTGKSGSYTIPDGVQWFSFEGCKGLTEVTVPGSAKTLNRSFKDCVNLKAVTLSEGIKEIFEDVFRNCKSLTSLTIPKTVKRVYETAFTGCSKLKEINVESGSKHLISVDGVLFNRTMTKLFRYPEGKTGKEYVIPNKVKYLWNEAFYDCRHLRKITIPNSVKDIGAYAFLNCKGLKSITIPRSVKYMSEDIFLLDDNLTIRCEAKSARDGWDPCWNWKSYRDRSYCPVEWGVKAEK